MKCPLFCIGNYSADNVRDNPAFDCLGEECAWWTPWDKSCAMLTTARMLSLLKDEVENLVSKMPHEEQFRK